MKKLGKKLVALLLVTAMGISATGCMPQGGGNDGTPAAAPAGTAAADSAANDGGVLADLSSLEVNTTDSITLRFNWWGGDSRHQATLDAIRAFEAKYPNIKVEAEYEAFTNHEEKIALSLKSGNAADVLQLNMDWVFSYSPDATTFIDLNQVANILDLTAYEDSDLEFFTTDGKLQAVPVSNTGRVFYWNKTTFEMIGASYPTTLDELLALGEQFADYDESYYPLIVDEWDRMLLMVYFLQCKYGKPWVTIENYEMQYSVAEIAEGLEFISLLEEKHVIPTLKHMAGDGSKLIDTNQNWINGKYAGIYMWDSNLQKHLLALEDGECEVGPFIDMGDYQGGMMKASMVLAIPSTSEHPAEAAALIQFLMAEEEGVLALGDSRGIPANKTALAFLDLSESIAAVANEMVSDWSAFKFDPVFEKAALKNDDGTYYLGMQMLSYGEDDAMGVAEYMASDIQKLLDLEK